MKVALRRLVALAVVAGCSVSALGLERMEDHSLGAVVAQDGITLEIDLNAYLDLAIEDVDGVDGPYGMIAPDAAMIYVPGLHLQGDVTIFMDVGQNVLGEDVVRIRAEIPPISFPDMRIYVDESGLGNAAQPGYAQRKDDRKDSLARMDAVAQAADPYDAILLHEGFDMDGMIVIIHLGTNPGKLLQIVDSDAIDIRIKELLMRDMHGGGAIRIEEVYARGLDLTGLRMEVQESGALMLHSPALDANVALSGVSFADRAGEVQSMLGNFVLTDLSANGTAIRLKPR